MRIEVQPEFSEDDWQWLNKAAAKQGLELFQFINALMAKYLPDGFVTTREMDEKEFTEEIAKQTRDLVRKARLEIQ